MSLENNIDLLGISVDAITLEETVHRIDFSIQKKQRINHVVINAWTVVASQKDDDLKRSITSSDLISADGQSIVWACRFLGHSIPERVPGMEIMEYVVELAAQKKYKCFFLGAREEVVQKVAEIYSLKYGDDVIAGIRNGYFQEIEEQEIAEQIAQSGAQILFLAMPSPKKENFIYNHSDSLKNIYYSLGVGGAIDVVAGVTKRAPRWMQRNGLEWFYRFIQEPIRMWKRYFIGNFHFIFLVIREKLR